MFRNMRVILREKKPDDAINDYKWKTDPELAKLDACQPLTMPFNEYVFLYVSELQLSPLVKHEFSIETHNGEHIGNCAYYNVNRFRREAEIGILIGNRDYWDKGYGKEALVLLIDYTFGKYNLKRVHLKTLEWNIRAQNCFLKCGFNHCGKKKTAEHTFILMELPGTEWETAKTNLSFIHSKSS
ncbi:MAG: GNAT family N-acetyltransferase [Dehalococcoidales bacterium]